MSIVISESTRTVLECALRCEITTVLKIAVNKVILELCDSCDYFASPLLM